MIEGRGGAFHMKSMKVYRYGRYKDEMMASVIPGTKCTLSNPSDPSSTCTYCPGETKQCLSKCPVNTYGTDCQPCHALCGACTGPLKTDCLYCNRDTSTNIVLSESFGNCTCADGYYFDETLLQCV
jgi:hypothetical protein